MIKISDFCVTLLIGLCLAFLSACSVSNPEEGATLTVSPEFFRVPDEDGRVQFSATVSGSLDKNVTWSLLSGPGSIDANGLYTSADVIEQVSTATVQAVKNSDTSISDSGNAGLTQITVLEGESLFSGVDEIAMGGLFVISGNTINLNEDEFLDLVTRNLARNEVSLLGGLSQALFIEKKIALNNPVAMVVGDFIVSGGFAADLAVASGLDQAIYFIQADSASWSSQTPSISGTIPITGRTPTSLATGKFHDAILDFPTSDLVVGTTDEEVIFFRQNRGILGLSLTETGTFSVGGLPIQMIPADFNQDGGLDLAVVRENSKDLFILFGNDNGIFTSNRTVSFPEIITFLAKGNFNGDDIPDLVAAHSTGNQISVLLGNGDGSFGTALQISISSTPGTIAIEDFNVGENDDIAIALPETNELFILYGDGQGKFTGDWRYSTGPLSPISITSGFFSGVDAPQGFQSIELIYMGINTNGTSSPADQFFLLSNQSN